MKPHGSAVYKTLELQAKVATASAHQLIHMLYRGALEQLKIARHTLSIDERKLADKALAKAANIVGGLHDSLSDDGDSSLPYDLARLYDYMQRQILAARLKSNGAEASGQGQVDSLKSIDEVIALLEVLNDAWQGIAADTGGHKPS
ncbi:MAG: flagellar export chaperone FliS [Alteromonadaceae bacterium]|nr:MAG: flagellar export chaperone FliS [Alteromonadaceae bacterium]